MKTGIIIKRIGSLLSLVLLTIYPCLFIYFQNVSECEFLQIIYPWMILMGIATFCLLLLWIMLRNLEKAIFIDNVLMLLILNFALIEKLLTSIQENIYYWHVAILLLFLIFAVGIFIKKKISTENARLANGIVALVFFSLTTMNGIFAAPHIIEKIYSESSRNEVVIDNKIINNLPNLYFLIFDEYGGAENLERYCVYDNSDFYSEMECMGFNISKYSKNETYYTGVVMTNLLNLDYIGEYSGDVATTDWSGLEAMRQNPVLYQILLNAGYQLNLVDASDFLDFPSCTYRFEGKSTAIELTAPYMIFNRTVFYPLIQRNGREELIVLNDMFDYLMETPKLQSNNLWTMAYFNSPHDPWFVKEDGTPLDGADRSNWDDHTVYLGQLKYLNKKMTEMVESIIKQDPSCIIIIQSDHGWRTPTILPDEYPYLEQEIPYMRNILNLVYYQNELLPIEDETGINTLRIVLNKLLNLELPCLPPDQYKGK